MPVLIRRNSTSECVSPSAFLNEEELELLLTECSELLRDDGNQNEIGNIEFVTRQIYLEAGKLDLLFVDSTGLPIAVEVKLALSDEARRKVVAQVIDYLSSLTELTVEELDRAVDGKLEAALLRLAKDDEEEFDRLWDCVAVNLRAGKARLVVALDDAPPSLERIFRFLVRNSSLDVQLLTLQRYSSALGDVIVPQIRVSSATERKPNSHPRTAETPQELLAVVEAYNKSAPNDARAEGTASNYRVVRLNGRGHYLFYYTKGYIAVKVHGFREPSVQQLLKTFVGKPVGDVQQTLSWEDGGYLGRGQLQAKFPVGTPPDIVAQAMRDLLALTRSSLTEILLVPAKAAAEHAIG